MKPAIQLLSLVSLLLFAMPAPANEFFAMDNALGDVKTLTGKAALLKELGYDGVTWRPGNTAEAMAEMSAKGIRMHALMINLAVSKDELPAELPLADIQALKGSGAVIWVQLIRKGGDDADAVRELRSLNAVAKPLGLRVAIYPHVNNHAESLEDALRVAELVADDNVGVSLTLCHQLKVMGMQDLEPLLQNALPKLFLVLVSGADSGDTRAMDWDRLIQPLGQGSYDAAALLGTLRKLGYKGPVGVIGYGLKQPAREHLRQSIQFLRDVSVLKRMTHRHFVEDTASENLPPRKFWHEPKREPKRPVKGYLGLQNHDPGDVIWFKEVSVRPLPDSPKPTQTD